MKAKVKLVELGVMDPNHYERIDPDVEIQVDAMPLRCTRGFTNTVIGHADNIRCEDGWLVCDVDISDPECEGIFKPAFFGTKVRMAPRTKNVLDHSFNRVIDGMHITSIAFVPEEH